MKIDKLGLIIKAKLKNECITFYKEVLQFEILFENEFLTCFAFNGNYLMIEPAENDSVVAPTENFVIRINVEDVRKEQLVLNDFGIKSHYNKYDWGEILTFFDPAGTKIELKDSEKFDAQIRDYQRIKNK